MADTIGQTNALAPVDQLISYLTGQIQEQQPSEEEMLAAAKNRYDPYFDKELAKVKEYYDMQRRQASTRYAGAMANIGVQRQALQKEYQLYMEEIETGRLRVGSDQQKTLARVLEDKKNALDQLAFKEQQNLRSIQQGFISREGLFSGSRGRAENAERQNTAYQQGDIETGALRTEEDAQTKYQRAIEDYAMAGKQKKAGLESGLAGLSAQQAGYQASISSAQEEANWTQREKEGDLRSQQQAAISEYVYGTPAYSYLGL